MTTSLDIKVCLSIPSNEFALDAAYDACALNFISGEMITPKSRSSLVTVRGVRVDAFVERV